MTGYLLAFGPCWACKQYFGFDPELVPSIVIDGIRQPLCRHCVARANDLRKQSGEPLIRILPGAYGSEDDK